MFHEERIRKVDVVHLGASHSGVFRPTLTGPAIQFVTCSSETGPSCSDWPRFRAVSPESDGQQQQPREVSNSTTTISLRVPRALKVWPET